MVLLYDDVNSQETDIIRDELLRRRIPCAVGINEELLQYCLVMAVDISYKKEMPLAFDPERVLYVDFKAIAHPKRSTAELLRFVSRVEDVLLIKSGFDPCTVAVGAYYDSIESTKYFGTVCYLPDVERLIMRFLAVCGENRAPSKIIAAYCLEGSTDIKAVAVHISKINSRLRFYSMIKAINSKKNLGYRLSLL